MIYRKKLSWFVDQFDNKDELNSHKREQEYKQLQLRDLKDFTIMWKIAIICGSKKWRS